MPSTSNLHTRRGRRGRRGRRTPAMLRIARERIERLFELAELEARNNNLSRANRYVSLARKIGMRYNVRIPRVYKRRFCKHCYSYLMPGVNCRVRIHSRRVIIYCASCGKFTRIPLSQ